MPRWGLFARLKVESRDTEDVSNKQDGYSFVFEYFENFYKPIGLTPSSYMLVPTNIKTKTTIKVLRIFYICAEGAATMWNRAVLSFRGNEYI